MNLKIPDKLLPIYNDKYDYIIAYGGRGGAKTWCFADRFLFASFVKKERILCTRETQKSIKDSVHRTLRDLINMKRKDEKGREFDLSKYFYITRDTIVNIKTGSEFLFYGLSHNVSEIKSLKGITQTWCEEAERITEDSWDLLIPTVVRENRHCQISISFNPSDEKAATYQRFIVNTPPNSIKIHINYLDNPFCPPGLIREAQYCKRIDYDKYKHIWLGEPRTLSNSTIFKDKFVIDDFSIEIKHGAVYFEGNRVTLKYGIDFGFSTDPFACIECFIFNGNLYITNELYEHELDTDDIVIKLKHKMQYLIDNYIEVIADSQNPATINQLSQVRRHKDGTNLEALNIRGCKKFSGSVESGITYMKNFRKIVIHSKCKNTRYEFENYKYHEDKSTGEILPKIIDKNNHAIDAIRYALDKEIQANNKPKGFIVNEEMFKMFM